MQGLELLQKNVRIACLAKRGRGEYESMIMKTTW